MRGWNIRKPARLPKFRKPLGERLRQIFTEEVVRIITVLDKTDDRAAAQAIQLKALTVLDNPDIRNAIED
jgi:hypothetical protein